MFAALKRRLTDGLDSALGRYAADKEFLEGAMAACAMIAAADGEIEKEEREKTATFIRRHDSMKHFDVTEAVALFQKYAGEFDFDFGMGQDRCLKEIREVKGTEKRVLVVRLAVAIAKADGEFEAPEEKAIRTIIGELGLSPSEFGL